MLLRVDAVEQGYPSGHHQKRCAEIPFLEVVSDVSNEVREIHGVANEPVGASPHQTPQGRARLRERTHVGRWQGRRARYLGQRKNLFDLRRVAAVHNLHVIARQPSPANQAA